MLHDFVLEFFSSLLVVEELSKVDGSVGVMVDIQNTLLDTLMLNMGSDYLKETYLPKLANNTVIVYYITKRYML